MHRVVERIHTMHCVIDEIVENPLNNMYGVGFAKELREQLERIFPKEGTDNKLRRIANYLVSGAPLQYLLQGAGSFSQSVKKRAPVKRDLPAYSEGLTAAFLVCSRSD